MDIFELKTHCESRALFTLAEVTKEYERLYAEQLDKTKSDYITRFLEKTLKIKEASMSPH